MKLSKHAALLYDRLGLDTRTAVRLAILMRDMLRRETDDLSVQMDAIEMLMVTFAMQGGDDDIAREVVGHMHERALAIINAGTSGKRDPDKG